MSDLFDIVFYRRAAHDPKAREPVFTVRSRASYQLEHACRDLGLHLARLHPELKPGVYPARLEWSDHSPELVVDAPRGTVVRRRYSQAALRGDDLLRSLPPERAQAAHYYQARPCDARVTPEAPQGRFSVAEPHELTVTVPAFPTATKAVPLDDLLLLGGPAAMVTDLPCVCSPDLLRAFAAEERTASGQPWVERGGFLVGVVCRDPETRDLVIVVQDLVRPQATGTVATLEWTPAAFAELAAEIERRRGDGEPHLRCVGWVHTHHVGELLRRGETADSTPEETAGPPSEAATSDAEARTTLRDGRFFSAQDRDAHRTFHDPASVGLVLDADAALADPTDLARCFAVFGTTRAVVVRRGLYLGNPNLVTLESPP